MDGADDRIDRYPGLAAWWRDAEATWLQYRSSDKRTLIEQLDYMGQLSAQLPIARWRVAYTASGNTLAAVVIQDHLGVIEHSLYWAPAATWEEAQYLAAVLNAPSLNDLVRPYQSVGAFGPRHFDKYVWQSPIPPLIRTRCYTGGWSSWQQRQKQWPEGWSYRRPRPFRPLGDSSAKN